MIGEAKPFLRFQSRIPECIYDGYKRHYYFAIMFQNHFHRL